MNNKFVSWIKSISEIALSGDYKVCQKAADFETALEEISRLIKKTKQQGCNVWFLGNGGSSAIASHFSQDLLNKHQVKSNVISDASMITCLANDYGYENVYEITLKVLAGENDLLIIISSSGESENLLKCADFSQENGMKLITLTAFNAGNSLWNKPADVSCYIPTSEYGKAEIGHAALLHAVIDNLET